MSAGLRRIESWFADQGWTPFAYQREVWNAWRVGEDGLVHVDTGMGKTLAAAGGPVSRGLDRCLDGGTGDWQAKFTYA